MTISKEKRALTERERRLVRRTVEICFRDEHPHIPGSLSAIQVILNLGDFDPKVDVFILSKGHASAALYAWLEEYGHKPAVKKTHPERDPTNGVICTAGSLGHGLPMGVGIALAKKLRDEPGRVHVMIGDGECLEGTTWESMNLALQWKLQNLIVHIDGNHAGSLGDLPVESAPLFIRDNFPQFVKYHPTIKGFGVSFLERIKDHKRVLTAEEFNRAMEELT